MTECRIGNAVIRIHGEIDVEKIKTPVAEFLKKVEKAKKQNAAE